MAEGAIGVFPSISHKLAALPQCQIYIAMRPPFL